MACEVSPRPSFAQVSLSQMLDWLGNELLSPVRSPASPPSSTSSPCSIQGCWRICSRLGRSSGWKDRHQRIRDWHSEGHKGWEGDCQSWKTNLRMSRIKLCLMNWWILRLRNPANRTCVLRRTFGDAFSEAWHGLLDVTVPLEGDVATHHVEEQHTQRPDSQWPCVVVLLQDPFRRAVHSRAWRDENE